jgi:hypothetical protein
MFKKVRSVKEEVAKREGWAGTWPNDIYAYNKEVSRLRDIVKICDTAKIVCHLVCNSLPSGLVTGPGLKGWHENTSSVSHKKGDADV